MSHRVYSEIPAPLFGYFMYSVPWARRIDPGIRLFHISPLSRAKRLIILFHALSGFLHIVRMHVIKLYHHAFFPEVLPCPSTYDESILMGSLTREN